MKKITCTFYRPEKVDIREFFTIVNKLEADFEAICEGNASEEDVLRYASELTAQARPLSYKPKMYFLGLDDPNNMPGDARVDFLYRPTYFGTAIIMKAVMKNPELLEVHRDSVRGMLYGCLGRGFSGHGYEAIQGLIETLQIFTQAECDAFIDAYPELCPEFAGLYREAMEKLEQWVAEGPIRGAFGSDYTEKAREVLALRQGLV